MALRSICRPIYEAPKRTNDNPVMKILVAVKRVVDYNVKIRVKNDHSGVALEHVKMAMNPFDEIAVEAAVQLKEKGSADELIAVSIGSTLVTETLRTSLALGMDRAIHVDADDTLEPLAIAKILADVARRESIDLVILGKQAIDGDNNQTGQMLSALLSWPQGTFISDLTMDQQTIQISREIDGGLEQLSMDLPAVLTTDLRLNEPRYASLPNIMKAKKKPLETINVSDLSLDPTPRLNTIQVSPPAERQAGIMLDSVDALLDKLRNEVGVIE